MKLFSFYLICITASLARLLDSPFDSTLKTRLYPPIHSYPLSKVIPNQYIVTFKPQPNRYEFDKVLNQFLRVLNSFSEGSQFIHVYYTLIQGAAFRSDAGVVNALRAIPTVDNIEHDQIVQASYESQEDAPWGLARVSQREKLSGSSYTYKYNEEAGEDVNVYVVDTGININHKDFEGRAVWGKTMAANSADADGHGHGTHCAGTIGGKTYGVAKKASLIAVKVLNDQGSGSNSDVIAGIEWAVEDDRQGKGKVISMSLGGIFSSTLDEAVNNAVDLGVVVVVAAGNESSDACLYSPARASKAVTVGATNIKDERAYFSNWGSCVDIFAPGQGIKSAWKGSDDATNTISGTSMACPHIAGIAATFISQGTESKNVPKRLNDVSTKGRIFFLTLLSRNRLGYNDYNSDSN